MPVVGVDHIACICNRIAAQKFGSQIMALPVVTLSRGAPLCRFGGGCRGCPGKFTCYQSPFLLCQEDSCSTEVWDKWVLLLLLLEKSFIAAVFYCIIHRGE
jgi:hypothetical protein